MKSIMYIGAALMAGASIYGFMDYEKNSRQKEFTEMYKSQDAPEAAPVVAAKAATKVIAKPAEEPVVTVVRKDLPDLRKYRVLKQKRLSYKLFSRAPLEDKYLNKKITMEQLEKTLKDEPVKKSNP